jgi:hypothetical protein
MIEEECLAAIAAGDDAEDILLRVMPTARRRFRAIDRALIKLRSDVQKHFPDAQYYTGSGGFNLMLGRSHSEHERAQQQLIALSGYASIGDGDF